MPEVDIRMNPFLAEALLEVVEKHLHTPGAESGSAESMPVEDADLKELWLRGLAEEEDKDAVQLLYLLRHRKFGRKAVSLEQEPAEAILRACSAVRLKIMEKHLAKVPSEDLESGRLNPETLPVEGQRAYACFLFLASLQSLLIRQLYPDIEEY